MNKKYSKLITLLFVVIFCITIYLSCVGYVTEKPNLTADDKLGFAFLNPLWCAFFIPIWIAEIEIFLGIRCYLYRQEKSKAEKLLRKITTIFCVDILLSAILLLVSKSNHYLEYHIPFSVVTVSLCILSRIVYALYRQRR